MATETPITNPAVKTIERTRSVLWSMRDGVPISIQAQRETQPVDAADASVGYAQSGAGVIRAYDRVVDETVDVNGMTIAVADLIEAQRILIDRWRAEDLVPPPPPVPLPP